MNPIFALLEPSWLSPDRIPVVFCAFLLAIVVGLVKGPVDGYANPLLWLAIDKVFGPVGERLDRAHRPRTDLIFRGFLVTAVLVFAALFIFSLVEKQIITMGYYTVFESILLSFMLTSGAVWQAVYRLYKALEGKSATPGAFYAVSRSTRTNLSIADNYTITRTAMGMTARFFDKGLIAPVFWYLIGGLPAAGAYSMLAFMAWRYGKSGFSSGFGMFSTYFEAFLGLIPGFIAAFLLATASIFTPTASIFRSFTAFLGKTGRATLIQGGYPLSVMAWALNVSLGGATQDLSGSAIKALWVGPAKATAKNDYQHLRRALYINIAAHMLFVACLCLIYLWAFKV